MPAGNTYEAIATQTLGSAAASVTFSSIPGTYTDLVLVVGAINTTGGTVYVNFNDDTATNYSNTFIYGDGSTAGSVRHSNVAYGRIGYNANDTGVIIAQFMNYSNTTTFKTLLSRSNRPSYEVDAFVTLWRSTSAINKILVTGENNFNSGTTLSLYGIKAA
jgi:hypothetical protein